MQKIHAKSQKLKKILKFAVYCNLICIEYCVSFGGYAPEKGTT